MKMRRLPTRVIRALSVAGALCAAANAHGAGFAITEQSGSGMGNAFAGAAASARDASTIFFNPAGMTLLPNRQAVAAVNIIDPSTQFSGTAKLSPALGGGTISGGNGGDPALTGIVPNLYYQMQIVPRWRVGLGLNAPFGLRTDYPESWKGRYQAVKSDLKTINLDPSVAFAATDRLSVGIGLDIQYAEATLTNAVDNSAVCLGLFGPGTCAPAGLATPGTPATDGFVRVSGDDWALGYNLGVLYAPTPGTRFGLSYRSKVHHTLTGTARFSNMPALFTDRGLFVNTGASAEITPPETVSGAVYHEVDRRLAVMGGFTWTHWSHFDNLVVRFDRGTQGPTSRPEAWQNTWRFSVGADYRYTDRLTLRSGLAYDPTPIPDAGHRTPRIPGATRRWLAVGASYQYTPALRFDLSYAHLFVGDSSTNDTALPEHSLAGTNESDVDLFGAQAVWSF